MNLGPRYVYKGKPFPDRVAERAALLASLISAPGLVSVDSVDGHHKGGHRVSLRIESARLDDFIKHMDLQDWVDGF